MRGVAAQWKFDQILRDRVVFPRVENGDAIDVAVVGRGEPEHPRAIERQEDGLVAGDVGQGEEHHGFGRSLELADLPGRSARRTRRREVAARLCEPHVARTVDRGSPRVAYAA